MPRAIVKQPNGKYALWSSVLASFILWDGSAEEMVAEELRDHKADGYPDGRRALMADLCQELVNINDTGRSWEWAPTWDEALATIRELHGDGEAERFRLNREGE